MEPMNTAPRDGRDILVTDREGVEAEAHWSDDDALAADDPATAGGYWCTEAGYMTRNEAVGWRPSLAQAIRVHGG